MWNPDPPKVEEDGEELHEPGYEEREFSDGFYKGIVVDGLREGQGVQTFSNGDVYEGSWETDCMSGRGVMLYANGAQYDGQWSMGKRSGEGKMDWAEGVEGNPMYALVQYEGSWVDNTLQGKARRVSERNE